MIITLSLFPLSSQDYHTNEVVQEMTSGYDSISDTDKTTSVISVISQSTQPAKERNNTSHCAEVEFCITTYPSSLPTGDIPVQYSDIRPDNNGLNIMVILINKYNKVHYQLLVVVIIMLSRKPHNTKNKNDEIVK